MKPKLCAVLAVFASILITGPGSASHSKALEPFFGDYKGQTVDVAGQSQRQLSVSIQPEKHGFKLDWTTIIPKEGGGESLKSYSIIFRPSRRDNIFRSLMGKNKFGNMVALDPMKGEPYFWARLQNKTLSVFALLVTADGGYEMQAYHRTLADDGLRLRFTRQREDRTLKVIEGMLKRTAP